MEHQTDTVLIGMGVTAIHHLATRTGENSETRLIRSILRVLGDRDLQRQVAENEEAVNSFAMRHQLRLYDQAVNHR